MQETLLTGSHLKKPEFHTRNCCSQLAILGSRLLTHWSGFIVSYSRRITLRFSFGIKAVLSTKTAFYSF